MTVVATAARPYLCSLEHTGVARVDRAEAQAKEGGLRTLKNVRAHGVSAIDASCHCVRGRIVDAPVVDAPCKSGKNGEIIAN